MVAQVPADRRRAARRARRSSPISTTRTCPTTRTTGCRRKRYALIGDAAWFTDALYSIGIETSCRQLAMLAPIIVGDARGDGVCGEDRWRTLNQEFAYTQKAVLELNALQVQGGLAPPARASCRRRCTSSARSPSSTTCRIRSRWRRETLQKHYRLQWGRKERLEQPAALPAGGAARRRSRSRQTARCFKKALLPGKRVYRVTWPLWKLPHARPYFFMLTRAGASPNGWRSGTRSSPTGCAGWRPTPIGSAFCPGSAARKADGAQRSAG